MNMKMLSMLRSALGIMFLTVSMAGCALRSNYVSEGKELKIGSCAPRPCVKASVGALPLIDGDVADEGRERINGEVARVLYASIEVENESPSKERLVAELQSRFDEYSHESNAEIDWVLTRKGSLLFRNENIVAFEVINEGYLGAAHGFKERTLLTFNLQTGERLTVADVVDDASRVMFSRVVEAEFRRARNVRRDESLQDAGFFVLPGQEMPLPENFALTTKGLELHYNPYDVGPYAMGETRVTIPPEAVEPLLKAQLRDVFAATPKSEVVK